MKLEPGNASMSDVEWGDVEWSDAPSIIADGRRDLPLSLPPDLVDIQAPTAPMSKPAPQARLVGSALAGFLILVELFWFAVIGYAIWRVVT